MREAHPLLTFFMDAADNCFPPVDGRVTVLPPLPGGLECSVAFTGHAVVATAMTEQVVYAQGPDLACGFTPWSCSTRAPDRGGGVPVTARRPRALPERGFVDTHRDL
ncbi:hypothetical protein SAMN05216511_1414 [Streptomyces sp. KS_16]|nr:hypothetical protein BX261_5848 [Streptomyces sp. 2321.6]SDR05009.1 hypothetical protein SAMN05216511_1414 [Streptomyces sp. KS_16]SED80121.1 hypothetical protein SAMN05428940_5874 [Streptomyces sp. 2133.1]SNC72701.1 hypothetical protein SAMN06272741_5774 [Streptomyces sp. 2114.4]